MFLLVFNYMLPIDLIFVRHGQSEGNVANKASRKGDNSFFTPEFRERHSRAFRLTNKGIEQAKSAGFWLKKNNINWIRFFPTLPEGENQLELENLGHDDFIRLDELEDSAEKIRNCQIIWYTRRDPENGKLEPRLVAVRSVCPWDSNGDYGWRRIKRNLYSNKDLIEDVQKYPRHIKE
ncbi:MAG: hypothetical protein A3J46_03230 [Candidatus Yanofskybacteria bacterium RIFCSPHIGHO2_02_FULL_41_11]|uniref:Uncharacterized protein n=1 Tax=Candidatus Yanofskybacteria bacterium RIFCSPHIGHO2_02_FULL_41_11 TaxID=1802675 RepID=A0A1F8F6G8_9BACT|nr:MAG: hypothetical protein A3J46_03230 [Candidatus Yanofskybacteria bacterium RIFCSPHIGHO2_02_FULL_41_11]